ncbi:MAG TPA: class I SAM-dependent methyltransferase [Gemmatimonadaceae bacterium]|jgi:protein arginine N-methyltransferase 1
MYTVSQFLAMVNDRARTDAMDAAIRRVVRPGDRVLDLGCGFGYWSVIACQAGAAHVDAVDINPAVTLVPQVAKANGCEARIAWYHADGARVALPAPPDVLISDLRGTLPISGDHLPVFMAVRDRQLRPGARLVWERDTLWVAPSEVSTTYRRDVLQSHAADRCDITPILSHVASVPYRTSVERGQLLGAGVQWAAIDYATVGSPDFETRVEISVARDGLFEALTLWFDAELQPGIGFSNAPGTSVEMYRNLLLPLAKPFHVKAGQRMQVELRARHVPGGYVWQWRGETLDGTTVFDHHSLAETVMHPTLLPPPVASPLPTLGVRSEALAWLLTQLGRSTTVAAAAGEARRRWPALFTSESEAERWVQASFQQAKRWDRGVE